MKVFTKTLNGRHLTGCRTIPKGNGREMFILILNVGDISLIIADWGQLLLLFLRSRYIIGFVYIDLAALLTAWQERRFPKRFTGKFCLYSFSRDEYL